MPEQISVSDFLQETWDDFKSPTTSVFTKKIGHCRNTVSTLEERLDQDRSGLTKTKKSVKALYNSVKKHVENDVTLAENLENLGSLDQEKQINDAFCKFSHVTKELSDCMKDLVGKMDSMLLYPLDSFLKGDLKGVKGDMKKPFDKAWKEYETKFSKIEKEKKQQAKEAGMVRTEVAGSEIAEEMEKERKYFQLQLCEYLIKVNEIKTKKGVDLLLHLVDYYKALTTYFQEGLKTINHFQSFIEELVTQLNQIKQFQTKERQQLVDLRESLRNSMSSYKESAVQGTPAGYNLHQLQGNKMHGCEKEGYLLKKSEGRLKKWQRRKCKIKDSIMAVCHSDEKQDPVRLNLLTCQVKLVPDDIGKKCFDLVCANNRTYHFQADDEKNMEEWISVLNNAKEEVLLQAFKDNSNSPSVSQSVRELTSSIIDKIKKLPGNKVCCDCGQPDPEWLSTNLGVVICLECCGIHRNLGVHISRTQSLVIDELGTSQLLLARVVGNTFFNDIMEAKLDPSMKLTPTSQMNEREQFIKAKYEQHKFAIITCTDHEDLKQDLKQAIVTRDLSALFQVYAEGIDLMSVLPDTENGDTALHLAIEAEDGLSLHLIDFIIQNSSISSLGTQNREGNTALHLCALENKTECLKLLLRTKPDLANKENTENKTPLDIAKEYNHQLCSDLLMAAIKGKKDVFQHVNIDWNLSEDQYDGDHGDYYSDDDLDGTPDRKPRSRPPSLVTGAVTADSPTGTQKDIHFDLKDMRERSDSTKSLPVVVSSQYTRQKKLLTNPIKQRQRSLQNYVPNHQSVIYTNTTNSNTTSRQSQDQGSSSESQGPGPPLPPRGKKPPPPPPPSGHTRNKSEPFFNQVEHRRTPSDPPPRPAPPEFRNTIIGNIGAKQVLPPLPIEPGGNILPSSIARRDRSQSASEDNVGLRLSAGKDMPPPIIARVKKKTPIGQHCKALFDCEADNEDELTFREGETIVILREEEDDWWEGEILGQPSRKGVFPKTFVALLPE